MVIIICRSALHFNSCHSHHSVNVSFLLFLCAIWLKEFTIWKSWPFWVVFGQTSSLRTIGIIKPFFLPQICHILLRSLLVIFSNLINNYYYYQVLSAARGVISSIPLPLFAADWSSIFLFSLPEEVDVKETINTCQSNWTLRRVTDIESALSVL